MSDDWRNQHDHGTVPAMDEATATRLTRRGLIGGAAGLAAAFALPSRTFAAVASGTQSVRLGAIKAAFDRLGTRIAHRDRAVLVDFSRPSAAARFHVVDLEAGTSRALLVAHGRGSDPAHSGWLQRFSNQPGSYASSRGAYLTDTLYVGQHGRSQRLVGLESSNDNALSRAIVIHAAWYAEQAMIAQHGVLGRSEGCFAVGAQDLGLLLDTLGPGRLLLADKF